MTVQEKPFPQGNRRAQLAKAGLIGKVSLSSAMSEDNCGVHFGRKGNY